jgi:hypothetical protein
VEIEFLKFDSPNPIVEPASMGPEEKFFKVNLFPMMVQLLGFANAF